MLSTVAGAGGAMYIASMVTNVVSNLVNGNASRKQQAELNERNHKQQLELQRARDNFTLEANKQNYQRQCEIALLNHKLRLQEQENNFKQQCQMREWQQIEAQWPLNVLPAVMRHEQCLEDQTISLRVILSKSANPTPENQEFQRYIYPSLEYSLKSFVNIYNNDFQSRNIIFYDNACKNGCFGGAFNSNVHYGLRDLPVVILEVGVLSNMVSVSTSMWGMGNNQMQNFVAFELPYDGTKLRDQSYKQKIADSISAHVKFVAGCIYDLYNLVVYDRMPLLPKAANRELERKAKGPVLGYTDIQKEFANYYGRMYSNALGTPQSEQTAVALIGESKATTLHKLRLEYAYSVKDIVSEDVYASYLDESVRAWVKLRTDASAEDFLQYLLHSPQDIGRYVSEDDRQYFVQLCEAYRFIHKNALGALCCQLKCALSSIELFTPAVVSKNVQIADKFAEPSSRGNCLAAENCKSSDAQLLSGCTFVEKISAEELVGWFNEINQDNNLSCGVALVNERTWRHLETVLPYECLVILRQICAKYSHKNVILQTVCDKFGTILFERIIVSNLIDGGLVTVLEGRGGTVMLN